MLHGISTLLLGGAAALASTALLTLIPWSSIQAAIGGQETLLDRGFLLLFFGSPLWLGMLMYAASLMRKHRQAFVSSGTQHIPWNSLCERDLVYKLRKSFPILDSVSLQVRGNVHPIDDPGGRLHVSPRCYLIQGKRVIIFPSVLWKRLQADSSALGAVIAHELAHFQHRDMECLSLARRLLWGVTVIFIASYLLSMFVSIQADLAVSSIDFDWSAVRASFAGKTFHFSILATLTIFAMYIRVLAGWREALADSAAIVCQGETALLRAELLISGAGDASPDFKKKRLGHVRQKASTLLTPFHWLLLGVVIVAASTYLVGPFAYLQNHGWFVKHGQETGQWIGWIAEILFDLLPYSGFLLVLRAVREHAEPVGSSWSGSETLAKAALCLVVGGSIGFVLVQSLPLAVTAILMPNGYSDFERHDPGALLISSILGQLGQNAWHVFLGLLGIAALRVRESMVLAWLPGILWTAVSFVEREFFPLLMEGWLAPLAVGSFATLVLALTYRRKITSVGMNWLSVPLLALLYWVGLGDFNHLAISSSKGAARAEARGDVSQAIELHRQAVFHAPGLVEPKWALAGALSRVVGDLDEAIIVAESAIDSALESSWRNEFAALTLAADLRLERRNSSDLTRALYWYMKAEWLWRNNSRLPKELVAGMLYNQACAALLRGGPSREVVSGLLEALSLNTTLGRSMLHDPDLAALNLKALPLPGHELIAQVVTIDDMNARRISQLAARRGIAANELASVLAHLARVGSSSP